MKKLSLILCIIGCTMGAIMAVVTKDFVMYSILSFVFAAAGALAGIIINQSENKKGIIKKAASVMVAEIGVLVIVALTLPIFKTYLPAPNTVAPTIESKSYQSVSNSDGNNSKSTSYGSSGSSSSSNYTPSPKSSSSSSSYSSGYKSSSSGSSYSSSYKSSSGSSSYSSGSSGYDYDKGYGYTAPKKGESFSDYVKRQDPELYKSMKDIYDSLD